MLTQFVLIKVINAETGELLYQHPMTLDLSPIKSIEKDPYMRIPSYARTMVLGENSNIVVAAEFAGGGVIDEERNREIEFFFPDPFECS